MSPNILRLVQWSVIKNLSLDCNDLCYLRWFKESFSQRLFPLLLWKLLHLNLWSDWWVMNSTRDTLTSSGHRSCKLSLSKHKLQPVPVKDCLHSRRYLTACKNSLILTCKELCLMCTTQCDVAFWDPSGKKRTDDPRWRITASRWWMLPLGRSDRVPPLQTSPVPRDPLYPPTSLS